MSHADDDHFEMAMSLPALDNSEDYEEDEEARTLPRPKVVSSMLKVQSALDKQHINQTSWLGPVEHIDEMPPLLLRRIWGYLNTWELTPCRLVSKHWNDQVLNHTQYPEKTFIFLTHERISSNGDRLQDRLKKFDKTFRKLRILRSPQYHCCALSPPFSLNLVGLELFHCGPLTWAHFIEILTSCPNLEELILRKCTFKWPYDLEEWKLKYDEFKGKMSRQGTRFPDLKAIEFRVKDPHDVVYMWKFLLDYSTRLQRISFSCKTPAQGIKLDSGSDEMDDMYETVIEMFDLLVQLVNRFSSQGLELLHCYLLDPGSPPKSFSTLPNCSSTCTTGALDPHTVPTSTIINRFPSEVLAKLELNSLKLKSFCLYGGEIGPDYISKQTEILAKFVRSQQSLDKVILPRIHFQSEKEFSNFLRNVPRTVKTIRIPSFGRMPELLSNDFHKLREYYIEAHGTPDLQIIIPPGTILPNVKTFSFYNCSDWVWQTVKIMTIVNCFPCLTELLIRDDGTHQCTRIGDSDIQNICRYFPGLRKLYMTNVDCVTDFGLTGISEKECRLMNETRTFIPSPGTKLGYSLSTLKQLEYLCLSNIGFRVTNVSMVFGFVFSNLRFLALAGYPKVSPWGVESLKNNNTKLKRLNLQFNDPLIAQVVERLQSS